MNKEIETLKLQNRKLQKQIDINEEKIYAIRSKCNHKYEETYAIGNGDYEYTCKFCGDSYVR